MSIEGIKQIKEKLKNEMIKVKENKKKRVNTPYLDFFKALTLCHTVVCDYEEETNEIKY
jgi:hypothetical protein